MQIGRGTFRFDNTNRDISLIDINLAHFSNRNQIMQGKVSLNAAMKKISVVRNRPLILKVSDLVATEMVDTGSMFDGQDPCLQLGIIGQIYTTAR